MQVQTNYSDVLCAARCIADYAVGEGILNTVIPKRPIYNHIGAVLADSVLQAGLNYAAVVRPRVQTILETFPNATTINALIQVIEEEGSSQFLQWQHKEKVSRFDDLVEFLNYSRIDDTIDLGKALLEDAFRSEIREVRGVGAKTVDYMACLVGVDCIAVDRHIRGFAKFVGLENDNYEYLRNVFSFAADLLSVSRREFDASIWYFQSTKNSLQMTLDFAVTSNNRSLS